MSLLTRSIGLAKQVKHRFQDQIRERTPVWLSPVRRVERVALPERVCAMTFDDGPCRLPANPDYFNGKPLTLVLAETLEQYGARGSFDVVGDTSGNYPDTAGKHGSASWGGVAYDHYPDFGKDADGGALHCPELIDRLLQGGHEITSHTYSHVLFGKKNLVYNKRHTMTGLDPVVADLEKLHQLLQEKHNYEIKLSRPPHYVDGIAGGFSSYDAYGVMGYQYMAASFDGAGWLPLPTYEAEVEATWKPIAQRLQENPDYFCGQIIFQKDGYNMARRSPIASGLSRQLELLAGQGYTVIPVSGLLERSPFLDLPQSDPRAAAAKRLLEAGWCPAFRDNTLRADTPLTRGAAAMMAFGWPGVKARIALMGGEWTCPWSDVKPGHPYAGALLLAAEAGCLTGENGRLRPEEPISAGELEQFLSVKLGKGLAHPAGPVDHGSFFLLTAELLP
ncbi:MAG: polysaccharide deacetylase family protein [Oscillospiraceae bacterium]|nr:polysaccharide deacetylase family protein [Oscillospiraceae bacterium]